MNFIRVCPEGLHRDNGSITFKSTTGSSKSFKTASGFFFFLLWELEIQTLFSQFWAFYPFNRKCGRTYELTPVRYKKSELKA